MHYCNRDRRCWPKELRVRCLILILVPIPCYLVQYGVRQAPVLVWAWPLRASGRCLALSRHTVPVGSGPFPTELNDATGEELRAKGHEFGATTGRPRRCGWLDLVALKYSVMINGVTSMIMTKPDVLSGFDTLKVCVAYRVNGVETQEIPFDVHAEIEPVYREFKGWSEVITIVKNIHNFC